MLRVAEIVAAVADDKPLQRNELCLGKGFEHGGTDQDLRGDVGQFGDCCYRSCMLFCRRRWCRHMACATARSGRLGPEYPSNNRIASKVNA